MEPAATCSSQIGSRRRPLHTCAVSFIAIAAKAHRKAENLNAPLGSVAKRIAKVVSLALPFVQALQWQLLTILSLVDDRIILPLERTMEAIFPPWKYLFNEIDRMIEVAEGLPGYFDHAVIKFPAILHRVPVLNLAVDHTISWLKFLLSMLNDCGKEAAKEKEISVDVNCDKGNDEAANFVRMADQYPLSVLAVHETTASAEGTTPDEVSPKPSYKDALERGTKGNSPKMEDRITEEIQKIDVSEVEMQGSGTVELAKTSTFSLEKIREEEGRKMNIIREEKAVEEEAKSGVSDKEEIIRKDDQILALFDRVWQMKLESKGKRNMMTRSVSYHG